MRLKAEESRQESANHVSTVGPSAITVDIGDFVIVIKRHEASDRNSKDGCFTEGKSAD
jgi:hypothetical protein